MKNSKEVLRLVVVNDKPLTWERSGQPAHNISNFMCWKLLLEDLKYFAGTKELIFKPEPWVWTLAQRRNRLAQQIVSLHRIKLREFNVREND